MTTVDELSVNNTTGKPNYDTDQGADYISRDNRKWDGGELGSAGNVTFSFLSNAQAGSGYQQLTATQIATSLTAMEILSSIANITFTAADGGAGNNISNQGEIKFQGYDGGGGGWASWIMWNGGATSEITDATIALGGSSLSLALHEVGHAIALSHPGDYDGAGSNYQNDAEFYQDSEQYSVMSYWNGNNTGALLGRYTSDENGNSVYMGGATGLGLFDIAALQRIYGANEATYTTDTTYGFNSNTGDDNWTLDGKTDWINAAIWDAGGIDTIDMSGYSEDADIDLREEAFSSTGGLTYNLSIAKGAVVENAIGGAGNDELRGNAFDNELTGGEGNDILRGEGGDDKVYAGGGTDKVYLGDGDDYVKVGGGLEEFHGGAGKDYISYYDSSNGVNINLATNVVSGSWAVNDTISGFESASGSKTGDDVIYGTSGSNTIKTYGGDDKVYAGGGTDKVYLGNGDDYVKVGGGVEEFHGGAGKDYISYYDSSNGITIDLSSNVVSGSWAVNDTISGFESASGSKTGDDTMLGTSGSNTLRSYGGDDKLYGRSGDDKLYGGDGADRFDGGAGTDLLYGGADADIFHFDHGEDHDIIKDFENNIDTIQLDNFTFGAGEDAFDFATQIGADVVFDFGGGDMLTVEDATIAQLNNDLEMV